MRTVVIVADFGYVEGGAAKVALDSVRLLYEAGLTVILFCGSARVVPEIEQLGIRIVRLGQHELKDHPNKLIAMRDGLWNRLAARRLKELLATLDPKETIVHVHSWTKILSPSVFSVLRKNGFRTILTAHDYFLGCPNGAIYDYVKKRPCPYRGGSLRCLLCNCDVRNYGHKIWRWVRQRIVTFQLRRFVNLELVTISNLSQHHLQEQIGTRNRCVRVNNPMQFGSEKATTGESPVAFVFIGRVSAEKDPLTFAEAVSQCGAKGIVIGDGELLTEMKSRYPEIEYTGWCNASKVREILATRTIALVFTSVWYETAGLTPLEAMSVDVPCIISDRTAATEYIQDGRTGLLFKCGDVDDLCEKIAALKNPSYRKMLSENIKSEFDRNAYSEQTYVNKLLELYKESDHKERTLR